MESRVLSIVFQLINQEFPETESISDSKIKCGDYSPKDENSNPSINICVYNLEMPVGSSFQDP